MLHKKYKNIKKDKKGFTLIELLVVISIIALLSSVVLASLQTAREKARDARRASDIKQLQIAIELYRSTNGNVPDTGRVLKCLGISSSQQCWGGALGNTTLNNALTPFISTIPKDPGHTDIWHAYTYRSPARGARCVGTSCTTYTGPAGSYVISWVPENGATMDSCRATGGEFGVFDYYNASGSTGHCPSGSTHSGSHCRQCALIVE